jgi:hypothetical protein
MRKPVLRIIDVVPSFAASAETGDSILRAESFDWECNQ